MKPFLVSLAMLFSTNAAADWVSVEANEDLEAYVDLGTKVKNGSKVTLMELFNYKGEPGNANGESYSSSIMQEEYDCAKGERRRLYLSAFASPMANGNVVLRNEAPGNWKPVLRHSVGEVLWKVACESENAAK
jgi:hypothetical protein